jgi:ATP-dependent protease ClpP protease subunit
MQAADSRIMMPNANMMIHDGTEHLNGHCRNVEAWAAHAKKVRHIMYKIYADRSGKSVPYWSKRCVIDLILSAEEAVEIGTWPTKYGNRTPIRNGSIFNDMA